MSADRPASLAVRAASSAATAVVTSPQSLTYLSLFSGIGGLDLGLDRAGMTCVGQVEINPFCRRVLAKHWPEVPRHDDVRTAVEWWAERPRPGVVAGGFPCQPVSVAGRRKAQADDRWLWPALAHVIRCLRPRYALLENVPGLLARGFGDVVGDLAELGYDTEWDCIPAAFVGARHIRRRVIVVAYPQGLGEALRPAATGRPGRPASRGAPSDVPDASSGRHGLPAQALRAGRDGAVDGGGWAPEPAVGRVVDGLPDRVDRVAALGNAVVPQVAELVGRLIVAHAQQAVAA